MPLDSLEEQSFGDGDDKEIESRTPYSKREHTTIDFHEQLSEAERPTLRRRRKLYETKYFWLTVSVTPENLDELPTRRLYRIVKRPSYLDYFVSY